MKKIIARVLIILSFVFGKALVAQNTSAFEQQHTKLLNDYVLFIDSVEKKQPIGDHFEIYQRKHISHVEFRDAKFIYKISKKVKVYKNGVRYEKIDWMIRYPHKFWYHTIYVVKQVGHTYRFIEQINYDFGKKIKETKMTTSIDDNYLRVHTPGKKGTTILYVKPMSSLPLLHQD